MNRIFIATADQDESEWFSDELKDFGRVVRVIDSLDFFVPQWESTEANIIIFMENIVHSEDSFKKLIQKVRTETPSVLIVFIYHRDKDEFIESLSSEEIICISYMELEPGVIEARMLGIPIQPLPVLTSSGETDKANESFDSVEHDLAGEIENDGLSESVLKIAEQNNDNLDNQIFENESSSTKVSISESAKEFTRQVGEKSAQLFGIIEAKKNQIREQKKSMIDIIKPDDLDYQPIAKKSVKNKRDRFVGSAVIAITGTEKGVGTTHTAIMISNYLARQNYSVILVEANNSNDYVEIEAAYDGIKDIRTIKTIDFNINGVKYLKNVKKLDMVSLLTSNYSFIVLDLGHYEGTDCYEEFLRANITIVVGSGSDWKRKHIFNFFHNQIHLDQSKWKLCVPFADRQTISDLKKKLPTRKVYGLSYCSDPYQAKKEDDLLLEDILKLNQYNKLNLIKKKMQAIFK